MSCIEKADFDDSLNTILQMKSKDVGCIPLLAARPPCL